MPTEPASPRFPLPESLARFFRLDPRARVPLTQVADLLGTTTEAVRALLRREGVPRRIGTTMPWTEAAAYLLDAWPRAHLLDALGPTHAHLVPADFHLTRVTWSLPIFLVRAMDHQAARAWQTDPRTRSAVVPDPFHSRPTEDYIADVLYGEIQPETVTAFRDDSAFMRALLYPVTDGAV